MKQKLSEGSKAGYDSRVGASLGRGPNLRKKDIAAPWSSTFPAPGATLDLDFANDRGFVRGVGQGKSMDAVTFTRASNGTFVGSDGLLKTTSANLLRYSQNFDNAVWLTSVTITRTANTTIAPDGTQTADTITCGQNGNTDLYQQFGGGSLGAGTYTLSVSVYKGNSFNLTMDDAFANGIGVYFNGSTGVGTTVSLGSGWSVASSNCVTHPNDSNYWFAFVTIVKPSTTNTNVAIRPNGNNSNTYDGNNSIGQSLIIWGAQLEQYPQVTDYKPTVDTAGTINTPRFDWASTAQVANKNLLGFTEDFSGGVWFSEGSSVLVNSTASPDGSTTADTIAATAGSNRHYRLQQLSTSVSTIGTNFTSSVYLKKNTHDFASVIFANNDTTFARSWIAVAVNLSTGIVTQTANGLSGTLVSSSITDVGSGWYRVSVTGSFSTNNQGLIYVQLNSSGTPSRGNNGLESWSAAGTESIYAWGIQVEISSSLTDYFAIAQPTTNTPLAANPTCNGLLIEESRANRLLWCRDATNAAWTKTNVTAAKDQTGIDGVANAASSLTASADNGTCIQTITLASGSRTGSVFLKRITGTGNVQVTLDGSTWSTVDLSASEWRRIVLSGTVTNPTVGIRLATNGDAVAMDYGQIEDGAFATSPILTTTASVTRSADAVSISGQMFSNLFNRTAGTLLTKYAFGVSNVIAAFGPTSSGSYAVIQGTGIGWFNSGITFSQQLKTTYTQAFSYTVDKWIAGSLNGGTSSFVNNSDYSGTSNALYIGQREGGSLNMNGTISRLVYEPKALNQNSLQAITSGAT